MPRWSELVDAPPPPWAERWVPDLHDDVARRRLFVVVAVLLLAGFFAFLVEGGDRPPDPFFAPDAGASAVPGFDQLAFRIRPSPVRPDADELADALRCALLADTPEQRGQGLMGRTDLAGYDGMLFRFPEDTTVGFHMEDTLLPLSIAWFDADGRFVSAADMEPCPEQIDCPAHYAARPYRYALEVPRGRLAELGVGDGSRLVLGGVCSPGSG